MNPISFHSLPERQQVQIRQLELRNVTRNTTNLTVRQQKFVDFYITSNRNYYFYSFTFHENTCLLYTSRCV